MWCVDSKMLKVKVPIIFFGTPVFSQGWMLYASQPEIVVYLKTQHNIRFPQATAKHGPVHSTIN